MDNRLVDLEAKIAKCDEEIRGYMKGGANRKQMAVQVMKRKKMYEQQRNQLMGQQFNVDQLAFQQEQVETTAITISAMKAGAADLKQQYTQMKIADVERLMDDMADLSEMAQEINDVMAESFAVPDGFDEAACEEEFLALEEEMKAEALLPGLNLPSYLPPAQSASVPSQPDLVSLSQEHVAESVTQVPGA